MTAFEGFGPETDEFFMAIRFNNNRDFFHSNHDWYERAVRRPCIALNEALASTVKLIDPLIDVSASRVVSHINRDLRYTQNKTPYRDYMWLHYRRPSDDKMRVPGLYFDIGTYGVSWGMGFWMNNKPLMNALRRKLDTVPEEMVSLLEPLGNYFEIHEEHYMRLAPKKELPEICRMWYPLKSFYLQKQTADESIKYSPALADVIANDFMKLSPLYNYIRELEPVEDELEL